MDNKVFKKYEEKINAAYTRLIYCATDEMLWPIKTGLELCKPLKLKVKSRNGDKIIAGDKVGVLATFRQKAKKWTATETSRLTLDEFEAFSDKRVIEMLLDAPAAQAAYGEDAQIDGLIPITEAVEIVSRGSDVHDLVTGYIDGSLSKPSLTVKEVNDLISAIGNPDQTRMLLALASALDKVRNEPGVSSGLAYENYLIANPFGADKLVHSLCVDYWTIDHEKMVLVNDSHVSRASLRELIVEKGDRYTEAIRKVVGKMVFAGVIPWVSLEAMQIRKELISRPMFLRD